MLRNFFVAAWRNLLKNRTYSFLNVSGLAIGIACAGLIFLWVEDEVNWDGFNLKKNQLYFVRENQKYETYTATFSSTPGVMGPAMTAEIPGVVNTCRITEGYQNSLFAIGSKSVYSMGKFVDSSIFDMFTLPFVEGNARNAFSQLHSLVITRQTAIKFFGTDQHVVGRTVLMDNQTSYVIGGVIRDIPENSSLRFEWVAPFEVFFQNAPWAHRWSNNCMTTIAELGPGVNPASINRQLYGFIQKRSPQSIARPFLWSMNQWHLYDDFDVNGKATGKGSITYVHLFSTIAWVILLIACINFMNLSTARSEKRAREVGVRKVLGAGKRGLAMQFLGEALFMALLAGILALGLVTVALPSFNALVHKTLSLGLDSPLHWAAFLSITLVCGIVAGSYPSLYLSAFNPINILKGMKLKTGSAPLIRKGLVVIQFTVSIALIISTIIIFNQIQHVKSRPLGFDKDHLLEIDLQGNMAKNYDVIRQSILSSGLVDDVALSDHTIINGGNNDDGFTWEGGPATARILISGRYVTPGFIHTAGMKLIEGRDLTAGDTMYHKSENIIITRSLEKLMGKNSALGKPIWYRGDTSGMRVIVVGVVDDYVYGNMYTKSDPVMFFITQPENTSLMYVRLKPYSDHQKVLAAVTGVLHTYNPSFPMQYRFVDDQFEAYFVSESLISKLSRVFAALAIFISCLGLFGLSAYTAERRTKEIGIRKVLGASVSGITTLISRDFLKLVLLSCLVAFPIAAWFMEHWLEGYQDYRIHLQVWVFAIAGVTALGIAAATVSFQAIRAALASPVKSLRTE